MTASLSNAKTGENISDNILRHAPSVKLSDGTQGKLYVRGCSIGGHTERVCRNGSVYALSRTHKRRMLACRGYDGVDGCRYLLVGEKTVNRLG